MKKSVLVIFAKYPEIGKVKVRLGKEIGYKNSMLVYKAMLKDIIHNISACKDYDIALCYTPKDKKNYFKTTFSVDILHPQINGNLGSKMMDCFKYFLKKYENVTVIGSDTPTINPNTIKNSFKILKNKDIVLGESDDGGYYLVGMKNIFNIFLKIEWSTKNVLKDTIKTIKTLNLSHELLKKMVDVDSSKDLKKIKKYINKNNCPNTFEIIKRIN